MANYVIVKDGKNLPERKYLTRATMSAYIKANGKKADAIWLKEQYEKNTKTTTVYCRDEKPEVSSPDVKVIRENFLERFFAEELAQEKEIKKAKRKEKQKEKEANFFDDLINGMED